MTAGSTVKGRGMGRSLTSVAALLGLPEEIDDVLAGNLCRCTGYAPIQKAAETVVENHATRKAFGGPDTVAALQSLNPPHTKSARYSDPNFQTERSYFAPKTEAELAELLATSPNATLVAGATDVGLWVTKQHRLLETVISLHAIESLKSMERRESDLRIGAMVSYSDAWAELAKLHPDLGELVRRIGSVQVRNSGTIGGNIANGSPIGDTPPPFMALDAKLELASANTSRTINLEDFFIEYGTQDLRPGEYVRAVLIPQLGEHTLFRTYKISKRFNQDISALCGAFAITIEDDQITAARVAYGGMAGTPKRATHCEAALVGSSWTEDTIRRASIALAEDYTPLTDMRAGDAYRMKVAQNLLRKAYLETQTTTRTRILQKV